MPEIPKFEQPGNPRERLASMKQFFNNYEEFAGEIMEIIDQKVKPLDPQEGRRKEPFYEILERRFGVENYRNKVLELLEHWREIIQSSVKENQILIHGDLGPGNIYVYDTSEIEPLDYEQAKISTFEILASILNKNSTLKRTGAKPVRYFRKS